MITKKFRTNVLIDDDLPPKDDLQFVRARRLKPTNLLRSKIKELREREEGAPTIDGLMANMGRLQEKISKLFAFLQEKELFEEFLKQGKN